MSEQTPNPTSPRRSPVGLIVALAGAVVLTLSLFGLSWMVTPSGVSLSYPDLSTLADDYRAREDLGAFGQVYLQALALLMAVAATLFAVLATVPAAFGGRRIALRLIAAGLAIAGIVAQVTVMGRLVSMFDRSGGDLAVGPWIGVIGFAVVAIGSLIGPGFAKQP